MRIRNVQVRNYRSIANNSSNLSDINIFIGKNNSGKSNLVKALFDYRAIILHEKSPKCVYENSVNKQEDINYSYHRRRLSSNRLGNIAFRITYGLNSSEQNAIYDYLHENHEIDSEFIKNIIDDDWFTKVCHHLEINSEGVVEDRIAVPFRNSWLLIGAKEPENGWKGFGIPASLSQDQLQESLTTTEDSDHTFVHRVDFDLLPGKAKLIRSESIYNSTSSIIPDYLRIYMENFLENWGMIDAFREPLNKSKVDYQTDLDPSGKNLPQTLHTLSHNDKESFKNITKAYIDIMDGVEDIRTPLLPDTATTVVIDETNLPEGIPLREISAGSKEILILITKLFSLDNTMDFLVIEEPELHLPSAEKKILNIIRGISEDMNVQTITTTHSESFVDMASVGNIVRAERNNGRTEFREIEKEEISRELKDMGYDQSGLLQSDAVIFVEGRSDRLILTQVSENNGFDLSANGVEVIELEGEGNILSDGRSLAKLLHSFQIPYLFIADSDGEDGKRVKDRYLNRINSESGDWYVEPSDFHIWSKYNIESYLMDVPGAIANVLNVDKNQVVGLTYDDERENAAEILNDVFQEVLGRPYQKDTDGSLIAKQIPEENTPKEFKEVIRKIKYMVNEGFDK